jgi:hypothetical protein
MNKEQEYKKAYYLKNKVKINANRKEQQREYYLKNKNNIDKQKREYRFKKLYNLTVDQYNSMLSQQDYSCGICKKHESEFKYKLRVDHCHTTGKVRELLCNSCNVLLGHSKENINNLNNAIGYLIKYNKKDN